MKKNDVVQFNEKHKWCGSLGIVNEVKPTILIIGVPIPGKGIAYIRCACDDVEYIGRAVMVEKEADNE